MAASSAIEDAMTKPTGMPRGRPRKSAEQKIREGNRGKIKVVDLMAQRRIFAGELAPPEPPPLVIEDAETLAIWNRIVAANPHLTREHEELLERRCCLKAEFDKYMRMLRRTGPLVKGSRGIVRSPAFAGMIDAERSLARLDFQLGLSPDPEGGLREPFCPTEMLLGDTGSSLF
jgi:phage terminase small subunit